MLQTVRGGNLVGKNEVVCLVSMLSSRHLKVIESRHPEVTKNPYYPLCPEWSKKKLSAHGLIWKINVAKIRKTTREIYQSKKSLKLIPVKISDYKAFLLLHYVH